MPTANITMKDHRSLFRQLLQGMYDAVVITDPSGHVLELNPRAREFFQCESENVMDRPISVFIPGVTPPMIQRIRKGLDQARHMMLDAKCRASDGTTFAAEVTVSAPAAPGPQPVPRPRHPLERRGEGRARQESPACI